MNNQTEIKRALIVRAPYAGMIVDGLKTWEMRSRKTNVRGRIGIIEAGTGLIIGEVDIWGSIDKRSSSELIAYSTSYYKLHRIDSMKLIGKYKYPWVLENATRYKKPVPYKHPKGAVIWVKL